MGIYKSCFLLKKMVEKHRVVPVNVMMLWYFICSLAKLVFDELKKEP